LTNSNLITKEGKEVFFKEVKRLEDLVRNVKLMEGWNEEI